MNRLSKNHIREETKPCPQKKHRPISLICPPLEKSILADFRGLDEKGKKAAIAYAEELIKQQ